MGLVEDFLKKVLDEEVIYSHDDKLKMANQRQKKILNDLSISVEEAIADLKHASPTQINDLIPILKNIRKTCQEISKTSEDAEEIKMLNKIMTDINELPERYENLKTFW